MMLSRIKKRPCGEPWGEVLAMSFRDRPVPHRPRSPSTSNQIHGSATVCTELSAALMASRVAELRLLGAWTAAIWGRAQSAPHEQILAEASRRADADFHDGRRR